MARPRAWETGEGRVTVLVPPPVALGQLEQLIALRRLGRDPATYPSLVAEYRATCEAWWARHVELLPPGALFAAAGCELVAVADGDTLCCACSLAEARAGRCHRTWAAAFLAEAGWTVVLDGERVR
jgi:hypothetical protein